MARVRAIFPQAFATAILSFLLAPAFGAVFTVASGSAVHLSGNFSIDFGGLSSGSGNLTEQGPGSLTTNLSGSIDANASASTLSFTGGTVNANSSGTWQPNGSPAAFGFQVIIPLSGPLSGDSIKFVGDIRALQFNVTGSTALSGVPGNQTFDTNGLALNTSSGTLDLQSFFCNPNCTDLGTQSAPLSGPPADILPAGTGTFARAGSTQSLAFPIALSDSQSMSQIVDGVNVTVSGTLTLDGNMAASRLIPEPSTWALLSLGIGLTIVAYRRSNAT